MSNPVFYSSVNVQSCNFSQPTRPNALPQPHSRIVIRSTMLRNMPHRLAQQRITLSDLVSASRAISTVAELYPRRHVKSWCHMAAKRQTACVSSTDAVPLNIFHQFTQMEVAVTLACSMFFTEFAGSMPSMTKQLFFRHVTPTHFNLYFKVP